MVQVTDNLSASAFSFSSPLGDGLVPTTATPDEPSTNDFRPRLGMGWFFNLSL